MMMLQSRRDVLAALTAAGAAGALGPRGALADEGALETTTLRLPHDPTICVAPQQIAEVLLRAEGFTDVRYVETSTSGDLIVRGELDFASETAAWVVSALDAGKPIVALSGIHIGCYELFAHEPSRAISDLNGKRVGVPQTLGSSGHLLLTVIAAQIGLDPHRDIDWVTRSDGDFMGAFAQGEVDAFLGFPPEPQELRARGIGRVILNITMDKPWSQYFCCTVFGNREFVRDHPVATKRYLRAILKSADFCAAEPELAAQKLVASGFTGRFDYALKTLNELPYGLWREYDPEDTMRFYALRLHEAGMITSAPRKLLAEGTDWRFLDELKRELKT